VWNLVGGDEWCSEHQESLHPVYETSLFDVGDIPEGWEPVSCTTQYGVRIRVLARHITGYG